ncbi:MAG: fluoride efflux transporter CrcB [Acetobacter peroxydans]|jgi:CrcB protein|nr:fluoride efflux transporter CrcB [Acetobacter peroxydans]MCI2078594.1 fluoride efflux transporter CrcB [Acetobacter peroxydans]
MATRLATTVMIGLGGACGTLLRYWAGLATLRWSQWLPWGTILINVSGSLMIAFFGALTASNGRFAASETMRLVFMVGICGGFTTFSSFSLQTLDLLRQGAVLRAMLNIAFSMTLCMASATAGYLAAQVLNASAQPASTQAERPSR